jgi:hypothetical protein
MEDLHVIEMDARWIVVYKLVLNDILQRLSNTIKWKGKNKGFGDEFRVF